MKLRFLALAALLAAAMLVPAAKADTDTTYNLTFSSNVTASYVWDSTTKTFSGFIVDSQYETLNITAEADAANGGLTTSGEQALLLGGTGNWTSDDIFGFFWVENSQGSGIIAPFGCTANCGAPLNPELLGPTLHKLQPRHQKALPLP
jgi:hypothetical protein